MFEEFARGKVDIDGVDISYVIGGAGPPVLLLHGFPQCKADALDLSRRVQCPALVFYGSKGVMARLFDLPAEWRTRLAHMTEAALPGGHFFVDQFPQETARILADFLTSHEVPG